MGRGVVQEGAHDLYALGVGELLARGSVLLALPSVPEPLEEAGEALGRGVRGDARDRERVAGHGRAAEISSGGGIEQKSELSMYAPR